MTPKLIKSLIFTIVACSLFAGIVDHVFPTLLGNSNFTYLFSLSLYGLKNFYIWQPLTYLFIYPAIQGIHAGYLINLAFSMFILWRIGTALCLTKGIKHFLALFFGAGLFSALVAFLALSSSPIGHIYAGTTPAIFALLMSTIVLYPQMELMLFLTLPIKAKWLIVTILASTLLIDLSNGMFINFFVNFGAMIFGYLYGVIVWKMKSSFSSLGPFEEFLQKVTHGEFRHLRKTPVDRYAKTSSRIYDFRTGERVIDDNTFIDACLSKISSEGKSSLTWREKFRLWRISKKKLKAVLKRAEYDKFRN